MATEVIGDGLCSETCTHVPSEAPVTSQVTRALRDLFLRILVLATKILANKKGKEMMNEVIGYQSAKRCFVGFRPFWTVNDEDAVLFLVATASLHANRHRFAKQLTVHFPAASAFKGTGMKDRRQRLLAAVEILTNLVRTIHLRRTLHSIWAEPHLNFWRVIYGNLTDMAVLEWCKLFGSDDEQNQPVHWKNITTDPDAFRKRLLADLSIYESKWRSYWTEMKTYRDQAVAHHDDRRRDILRFPTFDLALESANFYYDFLRAELRNVGIIQHPADLRTYGDDFAAQCRKIAVAAVGATKPFQENVF